MGGIYSTDIFGNRIEIECKITRGLPSVQIVGLANKSLDESKERIRAAFHSCKLDFPKGRVLVNLSPADLPKDGSSYDLPIAIAILKAAETIRPLKGDVFATGELSLDGRLSPVRGVIGRLNGADLSNCVAFFIPESNSSQAGLTDKKNIIAIQDLPELISLLTGAVKPRVVSNTQISDESPTESSYSEVRGQYMAKRALEIAAAGGHNILLHGPPGTGKSMLAKALGSILPNLTPRECLETTHIHSLRNNKYDTLVLRPPIRSPHHSASNVSIIGGGQKAKPGEISLSHNGVLFLDEIAEFSRSCIESLRQPLEDREIHIARAEQSYTYPASFIMIATMNPCPCGNLGSTKDCTCAPHAINQYQKKLSGPILDRVDLFVKVDEVHNSTLLESQADTEADHVRNRVQRARERQMKRNKAGLLNSTLSNPSIRSLPLNQDAKELLDSASDKLKLSPRAYFRVLRVAQTIADLSEKDTIDTGSIAESLQFRESLPTY